MVLAPPLVVTEGEVEEIIAKLKTAIDRTAKEVSKA
jgi:adenosylmethionine-8-amino-7-oxononanoate aminotransferase